MNTKCFFGFHKWKHVQDHSSLMSRRVCLRCWETQYDCLRGWR